MARTITVAAAHLAPVFMDAAATAAKAAEWIGRAKREGASLVVFPEVFLPGFPYWINCYPPLAQAAMNRRYQDQSVEVDGPEVALLCQAAREHGVAVVMGVVASMDAGLFDRVLHGWAPCAAASGVER